MYIVQQYICKGSRSQTSHAAVNIFFLFLQSAWWWLYISQNMRLVILHRKKQLCLDWVCHTSH